MYHIILFFIIFIEYFSTSLADLIWQNDLGSFIPINISVKKRSRDALWERSKLLESHKFQGELIKFAYYQENYLIDFYNDDTKVSGVCGEIWNILADYLNFTLFPIRMHNVIFGRKLENNSYDGLLGLLQRREVHVVPRVNFFLSHEHIMDYTTPLWKNYFQLYSRPEFKSNDSWVFKLFSFEVWIFVMAMIFIISILATFLGKISRRLSCEDHCWSFQDYLFYTFSTICSQGWLPKNLEEECKILELSKRIFSWFILITIGAHLVSSMTNMKLEPPYKDLQTLLNSTKYNVLLFNGSLAHEVTLAEVNKYVMYRHRFLYVSSSIRIRQKACWSKKKYAIVGSDDRQMASGTLSCNLVQTGDPLFTTWTTSGIVKGFKYKRAFDIGIIRLHETGLVDGLKDRWLKIRRKNYKPDQVAESISLYHVYMLFVLLLAGAVLSAIVCIFEIVIYPWQRYNTQKKKLIKFQQHLKTKSFLITRGKFRHIKRF